MHHGTTGPLPPETPSNACRMPWCAMVCTAGKGRSPFGSNATFWLVVAGSLAVLSVAVLMARGPKRHKASATSATHPPAECMLCDLAKSQTHDLCAKQGALEACCRVCVAHLHKASATSATHPPPECMLCDLAKSVSSHPPTGSQCRHRGARSRQHLHNTRRCYGP